MSNEERTTTVTLAAGNKTKVLDIGYYRNLSNNSPKVNGELRLRANAHEYRRNYLRTWSYDPLGNGLALPWEDANSVNLNGIITGQFATAGAAWARLNNECLARFTGKVRKHNASLGVTLATYQESAKMITSRSQKIATIFSRAYDSLSTLPSRELKRRGAKGTAGAILEGMFGWTPLVVDIQDAFGVLGRPPPPEWVKARARTTWTHRILNNTGPKGWTWQDYWEGPLTLTIASRVDITSENAFLLNRLGLLNLPGIAWDLVPWSWVVNLVSNASQMVNSITDFAGVSLSDGSTTRVASITQTGDGRYNGSDTFGYYSYRTNSKMRSRGVGGLPTPTFQFRIPNFDLGLAAIAWALTTQKVASISRLVGYK